MTKHTTTTTARLIRLTRKEFKRMGRKLISRLLADGFQLQVVR